VWRRVSIVARFGLLFLEIALAIAGPCGLVVGPSRRSGSAGVERAETVIFVYETRTRAVCSGERRRKPS